MNNYIITYDRCGLARKFRCKADSDGEASELFDDFADGLDDYVEIISIKEISE